MSDQADEPPKDAAEVRALVKEGTDEELRFFLASLTSPETADLLEQLDDEGRERLFPLLDTARQAVVLSKVETEPALDTLIATVPDEKLADIVEQVASDDAADLMEAIPEERRDRVLEEVEPSDRAAIEELQQYAPETAGGIMQKELLKVRADQTVAQAIDQIRKDWEPKIGEVYDIYVVDAQQRLLGRIRNRHLLIHPPDRYIGDFMLKGVRTVPVTMDQEKIAEIVQDYDLPSVAVVDEHERLVGRIMVDDIVDVMEQEATEDIQKIGGMEALGEGYLQIRLSRMVKKRAGWLMILFLGETLTASAMSLFEADLEKAAILALFLPLIISSGGNAGSQATTLVIRAMALGELRLSDWWRVVRREVIAGLVLGLILGAIGVARIVAWHHMFPPMYGEHYVLVAVTVGLSLVGCVLFGSLAGCSLPFVLRRFGLDPASASAPFVATLVDVTGLVIYFSAAVAVLRGTLL